MPFASAPDWPPVNAEFTTTASALFNAMDWLFVALWTPAAVVAEALMVQAGLLCNAGTPVVALNCAVLMLIVTGEAAASALTGPRTPAPAEPGSLGYELAAVSAEGGFEPSELVVPDAQGESEESADKPGRPD